MGLSGTEATAEGPPETGVGVKPGRPARALLGEARRLRDAGQVALDAASGRRRAAREAYEAACDEVVARQLAEMPAARLREPQRVG